MKNIKELIEKLQELDGNLRPVVENHHDPDFGKSIFKLNTDYHIDKEGELVCVHDLELLGISLDMNELTPVVLLEQ